VLSWKRGLNSSVRGDDTTHTDLGALANLLHYGLWVLTAPNSSNIAVHNTACAKSGPVEDSRLHRAPCCHSAVLSSPLEFISLSSFIDNQILQIF
jgi:hypothetical protein